MTYSLLNALIAPEVNALLDKAVGTYKDDPSFVPGMPRDQAAAIIHAVLWASGVRSDSFANAYAYSALYNAVEANKLLDWLIGHREFERRCEAANAAQKEAQKPQADPDT